MRDGFYQRYEAWLERLDEWCAKHKITRESAVSILYDDSAYNPNGGPDLIRSKDLYWAEGNDFVREFLSSNSGIDGKSPYMTALKTKDGK